VVWGQLSVLGGTRYYLKSVNCRGRSRSASCTVPITYRRSTRSLPFKRSCPIWRGRFRDKKLVPEQLLVKTDERVSVIAADVGFRNTTTFSMAFRTLAGKHLEIFANNSSFLG